MGGGRVEARTRRARQEEVMGGERGAGGSRTGACMVWRRGWGGPADACIRRVDRDGGSGEGREE